MGLVMVQASSTVYAMNAASRITIYNPTDSSAREILPWLAPSPTTPSKPELPSPAEPVPEPIGDLGSQAPKLL